MSIFPDDIRWFRSWLNLDILSEDWALWSFVIDLSSVDSFLSFPGNKSRNWSLKLIQQWWIFLGNFGLNFRLEHLSFLPFFSSKIISSLFKPLYHDRVVICKSNLRNLFHIISLIRWIQSLIWNRINSLLKNLLQIDFKLSTFTYRIIFIKICFLPSLICFSVNIVFGWIISSCDCLNIPIDISILLNLSNVIEVNKGKQVDENGLATDEETKDLSTIYLFFWNQTWHLQIKICIFIANIRAWSFIINPWRCSSSVPPV